MLHRSSITLAGLPSKTFMDISIGSSQPRRITFSLFSKKCPIAVENFVKLCTGEDALSLESTIGPQGLAVPSFKDQFLPQLTYRNSTIHRVVKNYLIQGGDIVSEYGTGQLSIYGENPQRMANEECEKSVFDEQGLIGSAVCVPGHITSQFFILTTKSAPQLNGTCICFGRVESGWNVVEDVSNIPINTMGFPSQRVTIVNCGVA